MAFMKAAPERGEAATRASVRAARRAVLLGGTAIALTFAASAAQAQCSSGFVGSRLGTIDLGLASSGTVSAVQSLLGVISTTSTAFQTQTNAFVSAPPNPVPNQPGGGVWVRGIGGTVDTVTPGSYSSSGNIISPPVSGSCSTRTFQDYGGVQLGADISRLNIGGANIHFGLTGGYTDSSVNSPTGSSRFTADFQTPFVGVYGALTKDSFFADAQLRWDFYHARLGDPSNGIFNQGLNARSFSASVNAGNQFALGNDFFVEPSAGITYSAVSVDPFNLGGTLVLTNSPGFTPPATVRIRDFDSILGRASLRVGRNIAVDGYVFQPFVTASVFNEFAGQVTTNINTNLENFAGGGTGLLAPFDSTVALRSSRIGTYGQFAAGVAGQIVNTGWLGYVRGDYRIGDRIEGFGVSAGLRYQFTPERVASAPIVRKGADAPSATSVPLITDVNWTGFSVGGSVGGLFEGVEKDLNLGVAAGRVNVDSPGIVAGGQVGYDYQFGNIVVGIAGDAAFTNALGARSCPTIIGFFYNCETQTDFLAMATGRVGYAMDRSLFYVKGGAAFGDTQERIKPFTGTETVIGNPGPLPSATAPSDLAIGWTIGAGFEFAITDRLSAKAEYMHYELERRNFTYPNGFGVDERVRHTGDLVRVGVNYRFNFASAAPAAIAPARAIVVKY